MRIIKPSTELLMFPGSPSRIIEKFGRVCYRSEDKIDEGTDIRFVNMILKRGHESVIEHISASVRFICDRGVSHEIVRHRLASYSQESTRYCNYSGDKFGGHITFIKPCFYNEIPLGEFTTAEDAINNGIYDRKKKGGMDEAQAIWLISMFNAEQSYKDLLFLKSQPQEARSVLPNSLKTELIMTANIREWRHFFKLRTSNAAHPQMREVAIPLFREFKRIFNPIFNDILV